MNPLDGKQILVTGATGLIGKSLIKEILTDNKQTDNPAKVFALCRSYEKAEKAFGHLLRDQQLEILTGDVCAVKPQSLGVQYIIHGASVTSSRLFVKEPVETIGTAVDGTRNMLEMARLNPTEGFLYLSSMEVYGAPGTDEKIREDHGTDLNPMAVRSSYPISKRVCESLCACYAAEYGVPAKVIRLTQTFGPGVRYADERVFADFARCVIEGRDIILHTKGETKRSYLAVEDAVQAILTVLVKGTNGEAYNAANEATYCSIREMAECAAGLDPSGKVRVQIREDDVDRGYAPVLHMNLDTGKLRALGWQPQKNLKETFCSMIEDMKQQQV